MENIVISYSLFAVFLSFCFFLYLTIRVFHHKENVCGNATNTHNLPFYSFLYNCMYNIYMYFQMGMYRDRVFCDGQTLNYVYVLLILLFFSCTAFYRSPALSNFLCFRLCLRAIRFRSMATIGSGDWVPLKLYTTQRASVNTRNNIYNFLFARKTKPILFFSFLSACIICLAWAYCWNLFVCV